MQHLNLKKPDLKIPCLLWTLHIFRKFCPRAYRTKCEMLGQKFSTFYKHFYNKIRRQNKMQWKQQQTRKTKSKSCLDATLSNTIVLQTVIPAVIALALPTPHSAKTSRLERIQHACQRSESRTEGLLGILPNWQRVIPGTTGTCKDENLASSKSSESNFCMHSSSKVELSLPGEK